MGIDGRGRKSATVFTLKGKSKPLDMPDMPPEEAAVWNSIVSAMPDGFFNDANSFLLRMLCSHTVTADMLAAEVSKACDNNDLTNLNCLSDMHVRESRAVADLSTRLKLTHRSRHTLEKATSRQKLNSTVRPWADPK